MSYRSWNWHGLVWCILGLLSLFTLEGQIAATLICICISTISLAAGDIMKTLEKRS